MLDRSIILEEYLKEKALEDAARDHIETLQRSAERKYVHDRDTTEHVLIQMQRDLESANDTIRVLQGERKTNEQLKLLYEEAKSERDGYRKEAIAAATEAETLRRSLGDVQDKVRKNAADGVAQEKLAQRLFEVEELAKRAKHEYEEKEAGWQREKTILLQQVDKAREMTESLTAAYERGRRAAEDEAEREKAAARVDLADKTRRIEGLEADVGMLTADKERLTARTLAIPELEATIQDLRNARNVERMQHTSDHTRQRDELATAHKEAQDWKVAYETAEKHKKAMFFQLEDVKKAYGVIKHERASLEARIELLQVQLQEARTVTTNMLPALPPFP